MISGLHRLHSLFRPTTSHPGFSPMTENYPPLRNHLHLHPDVQRRRYPREQGRVPEDCGRLRQDLRDLVTSASSTPLLERRIARAHRASLPDQCDDFSRVRSAWAYESGFLGLLGPETALQPTHVTAGGTGERTRWPPRGVEGGALPW